MISRRLIQPSLTSLRIALPYSSLLGTTTATTTGFRMASTSTTSTQKPVLIAGGGLASLLLGQSLLRNNIPFQLYERDASAVFRGQGYRLRLSSEGLDAIEEALGPEKWKIFWDTCGKTTGSGVEALDGVTGESLTGYVSIPDTKKDESKPARTGGAPEALASREGKIVGISRGDMRRIFMLGCEEHVKWSHTITGYESTSDGVRVIFADGSKSEEGSLLVGGEGIYSKVARQLSGGKIKVFDTGARGIHGQAPTSAFKGLGEGVWRIVDESRPEGKVFIITNVRSGDMDDPNVVFGWTMGAMPGIIEPPGGDYALIGKPAADIAKSLTSNWNERFRPLFDEMSVEDAAFWKITCSSPSGVPEWTNDPRVTVIGDAVHSMTPAGGNGANTAVRDSRLLGKMIAEAGGYKEGLTAAFEKEMRVYGSEMVALSYATAKTQFGINIDEATSTVV